jgi:site-specific DNA recombinase
MSKRAVLYGRTSYDDRDTEGRNLQGQIEMCREYAARKGYQIAAELAEDDRGASGASFELLQLNKVLGMAHAGEFDILVVREIDRLSRNLAKQLIVEEELKRAGVQIEYVLGEYPDTPEGNLMKHVKAAVAEYERLKIEERMSRGRQLKVKAGSVLVSGRPPYGYQQVKQDGKLMLKICEPEAQVVQMIFTWYVTGDGDSRPMTLAGISRRLSEMGILTFNDTGTRSNIALKKKRPGEWGRTSVLEILKNETYTGLWHFGKSIRQNGRQIQNPDGDLLTVEVPGIISRGLWAAAQRRLAYNRANVRREPKHEYLLGKHVTCGKCGLKMHGSAFTANGRSLLYYICGARHSTTCAHQCDAPSFRADQIDAMVWGWIKSFLSDPATLAKGLDEYQAEREKENEPVKARLLMVASLYESNEAQLKRLLDLYLKGDFPKEMLVERKTRLEATMLNLAKEKASLMAYLLERMPTGEQIQSIQDFAANIAKGLEAAETDFQTKRSIIEALDVQATLAAEDGRKVVYARCILGEDNLNTDQYNLLNKLQE